jgi:hypothetical protein
MMLEQAERELHQAMARVQRFVEARGVVQQPGEFEESVLMICGLFTRPFRGDRH